MERLNLMASGKIHSSSHCSQFTEAILFLQRIIYRLQTITTILVDGRLDNSAVTRRNVVI